MDVGRQSVAAPRDILQDRQAVGQDIRSGLVASAPATVTITVSALAPTAVADAYNVTENQTLTVQAPGVLSNDTDPNGLTLTAVSFTNPAHGTLTPDSNGDGGFVYKPDSGFYGTDSFTYEAEDSRATSAPATVTITVTVNSTLHQPSVTNATTTENTQTTPRLVVTPNAADTEVTNFQITNITGGTLFQNDGVTQITNGEFISIAQGAAGLKFTPTANSTASGGFTVQESTTDTTSGLGGPTANATITVTATNNAWATFFNNGPIIQGSTATVQFTNQIDPLVSRNPGYRYSYDFNDNGTFEIKNSRSARVVIPASYLLTPGPHVIVGRITDRLGHSTTYTTTITVEASVPTVTVKTPLTTVVPGEPVPLAIRISDSSVSAQRGTFTYTISFGDGTSRTVKGRNPLLIAHVYKTTGTYTVEVTVTDKYGNTSTSATQTINVVPVAVETDPFNKRLTALFVGGTSGNDTVNFAASGKNGIAVTLDGVSEGVYRTSGPLIVFGQGGHDVVHKDPTVQHKVRLLEKSNADNVETSLLDEAVQWAGLTAAMEILNT